MSDRDHVLVAGAGPVGLVAANVLADAGVAVTVFEAEPKLPETLRASTFQPPTLDMLARLGASQRLIEMGRVARTLQYRDRRGWVAEFDLGLLAGATQHPYRVQCEQFKLNRFLLDRLAAFSHASVEFSAPVIGVEQDRDSVCLTVDGLTGARRVCGAWLVGADGGKSAVRQALGVRLEGFTWPERFLVASTPFAFEHAMPGLADVSYFADADEWFFLLRVPAVWRVMFPTRGGESDADILSDDGIERRLQRVFSRKERYEIVHRTLYSVHQRVATAYRHGRAFLAGDAAHLNNPLGGMGMNGGIHDAFDLAGRLSRVIRGEAPEAELDGYEGARRPLALEYVNTISTANKRNLETRDPEEQRRWRETMTRAAGDRTLARDYLMKASMLASLRALG
jgi:3-(3-hydroxy-phenyl)propionate hydroxylase